MREFHGRLKEDRPKDEALRLAQETLVNRDIHPFAGLPSS